MSSSGVGWSNKFGADLSQGFSKGATCQSPLNFCFFNFGFQKTKTEPLKGVTLGGNTLDTLGVTPLNQNDLKAIYVNTLSPRSRAMRFLLGLKV